MKEKDYYEILGITDEERKLRGKDFENVLKKKYKKLCKEWHPDKFSNSSEEEKKKAEEKIKEINEANEVLSNQQKREEYDFRAEYGNDFADLGEFGFGSQFMRQQMYRQKRPGNDTVIYVDLTFDEMVNGCTKDVKYNHFVRCKHCNGTGSESGVKEKCKTCHGTGVLRVTTRNGNSIYMEERTCPDCGGSGYVSGGEKCHVCGGVGLVKEEVTQSLNMPSGVENGIRFGLRGLGDESPDGGENGNLIVIIRTKNDITIGGIIFERVNDDIVGILKLDLYDAWCGAEKDIILANKKKVKIKIPELCEDGKRLKLSRMGINNSRTGNVGDCYIIVKYKMPKKITDKQKQILKDFYND